METGPGHILGPQVPAKRVIFISSDRAENAQPELQDEVGSGDAGSVMVVNCSEYADEIQAELDNWEASEASSFRACYCCCKCFVLLFSPATNLTIRS